jgi:hypothetical protein
LVENFYPISSNLSTRSGAISIIMKAIAKHISTSCHTTSFFAILAVLIISLGFAAQTQGATSGPFNYVWAVPLSQYDGPDEVGLSLTQLSNGTIVVGGNDGNQPNYCPPNYGGAWLVAVKPNGGSNVWQKLYSTCASGAQTTSYVAHTSDGGFILAGGDFDNPACAGCGWFAKFDSNGSITWQHDLTGAVAAGAGQIEPTPDGGYIAVGNQTTTTYVLQALVMKLSATGELQWSAAFPETDQSFRGAFTGGNFTFETLQQTRDGGYIVSGVADAHFRSGYANVLTLMKLDANANVQWSKAYYGNNWRSSYAGDNRYPIFQTSDGGYILSGSVQNATYPFEELFFLLKLDARGRILWQTGYGGTNNSYHVSRESAGAVATADGGYVLAGQSDIFLQGTNGWMLKTDASGNILWQKTYTGLTANDGNVFEQVIQTSDGGYAVTGSSWTSDLTYGGPGLWVIKTDSDGNIGSCSCMQDTNVTPQPLDLHVFKATFTRATPSLTFDPVSIQGIMTSITPTTIYP